MTESPAGVGGGHSQAPSSDRGPGSPLPIAQAPHTLMFCDPLAYLIMTVLHNRSEFFFTFHFEIMIDSQEVAKTCKGGARRPPPSLHPREYPAEPVGNITHVHTYAHAHTRGSFRHL